jgi:hypothetical protein
MSSFQSKFVKMVLAEVEAAILKAATVGEDLPAYETPEAARDAFRDIVIADLTERLNGESKKRKIRTESTVTVPEAGDGEDAGPKEKKKRGPMTEEAKAAMKAKRDATMAAKKGDSPAPSATSAASSPATAGADSPKEKKKRGPMTEEAKAAMKAKRDATLAAKKEVDVLADGVAAMAVEEKPKAAKKVKDANLAKVDPTWRKHLKTAAKAVGKDASKEMEAALLTHLNVLTKEEFNAKKAEEHISSFLAPSAVSNAGAAVPPEPAKVPANLEIVEFEGKDYYVNPETKRVYEGEGEEDPETGGWTNYKPVGYVGMAAFTDMELE